MDSIFVIEPTKKEFDILKANPVGYTIYGVTQLGIDVRFKGD